MTENKRFKNVEEKLDWGTIQYFTYNDKKLTDDEIEDLVNHLLEENEKLKEENEQLKKALKNQYINEICETCKFGQYDVNWYGEGEFECLKRHDAVECDGKTECEDYELDLERFLE